MEAVACPLLHIRLLTVRGCVQPSNQFFPSDAQRERDERETRLLPRTRDGTVPQPACACDVEPINTTLDISVDRHTAPLARHNVDRAHWSLVGNCSSHLPAVHGSTVNLLQIDTVTVVCASDTRHSRSVEYACSCAQPATAVCTMIYLCRCIALCSSP